MGQHLTVATTPFQKETISVYPIGGLVSITLPHANTIISWLDAANFLKLLMTAVDDCREVVGDNRLHVLSPKLECEPERHGMCVLKMPNRIMNVPWQDALRFINTIAHEIRTSKVDHSFDRPLYDPEKQLAEGLIKLTAPNYG